MTDQRASWKVLLILLIVLLPACASSRPQSSAPTTKLGFCGSELQNQPSVVIVTCTSNGITARDLKWSRWGKPIASALGTAVVDLCAFSDCHTGKYRSAPVVVVASKLTSCPNGARAYSKLQFMFIGKSPFDSVPANLSPANFDFGSHRVLPGSKPISLTC
ncbi:MAG TPA: hypothetical protein VFQ44_11070 [Streptosporangiaceae bacterium]|nr:hypothetical protein [Streptosporangiaceae bacterium]